MALNALDTLNELENSGNQMGVLNVPRGMDIYRPKAEGDVTAIIVPYVTTDCPIKGVDPGDLFYCRDYWAYRGLGASKKERCIDNKKTFGERCAITESLADFVGDIKDKPKSSRLCLFNLYLVDEKKLVLLDFSYANFAEVLFEAVRLQAKRAKKAFVANFADPVEGSTITFTWKEDTFNGNKFFKASNFDFEQHGGLDKEILDKAANLDKVPIRMSFAEVSAMFLGEEPDDAPVAHEPPPAVKNPPKEKAEKPEPKKEVEAEEPETKAVPKKVKPGEGAAASPAPKKEKANTWSKGAFCFYEGKKCVVKKVDGEVISIAEVADDDERYKVSADDISPFENEAPKAKAPKAEKPVEPSKHDDAFDAEGWDD